MKADNRKNRICWALHSSRPAVWLLGLAVLTLGTAACSREGAVPPAATALETSAVYAPAAQETGNISPEATTEVRYADKQNAPMGTVFPGEEIQSVVVYGEKGTSELCAPEDIARALAVLEDLYDADTTVDGYDPDRDPDPWHMNMIGLATAGEKSEFNFSGDGALVWFCDGGEAVTAFPVKEPQAVKDFVAGYMRSTRGKTTGGAPAAGIDEPVKWLENVTFDAIRDVYLHRSVLLPGSSGSHGSTFGWMWYDRAERLPEVLRQVAPDSVSEKTGGLTRYNTFSLLTSAFPGGTGVSVRFVDDANGLAAILRLSGDSVELVLSDEPEKLGDREEKYLQSYTLWDIRDEGLKSYLQALQEEMPVVLNFAGAEYDWAEPVTVSHGAYSVSLRPIAGWTLEQVAYSDDAVPFGIRIRPGDQEQGWLYFSAEPQGFRDADSGCFWQEIGSSGAYSVIVGYDDPIDPGRWSLYEKPWRYMHYSGEQDYVIRNEGADAWMMDNMDAISDISLFTTFGSGES